MKNLSTHVITNLYDFILCNVPIDFHCMDKKYNESPQEPELFGYQLSSKYFANRIHFWGDYPFNHNFCSYKMVNNFLIITAEIYQK